MKVFYGVGTNDCKGASHILYKRWATMLSRCYNENDQSYVRYGGVGICVSERWWSLSNYIHDISTKENYDKLMLEPTKWHIDKDTLSPDNRCYSNETTIIISNSDNIRERNQRRGNPRPPIKITQYTKSGVFVSDFNSMLEAEDATGIKNGNISQCCSGKRKTAGGFTWKIKI